jgi:outer membrane protein assembly factor BamB
MFNLAHTVWPRFGGDHANRSLLSIAGPHTTPAWHKISLSATHTTNPSEDNPGGVIVMPDETLRVCHAGMLSAIKIDGTILWQLDLNNLISEHKRPRPSLPVALQTGETLLLLRDEFLIVDKQGKTRTINFAEDYAPDDSGYSPNLTYNGQLILTDVMGDVLIHKDTGWQEIGVFGYDIVPPAIYPDNSLAISGYAHMGFCRVSLDGEIQWQTQLKYADLLPTLNYDYIAAVGSLDQGSAFFRSNGEQIGEYQYGSTFAVYPDGGWIALSKKRLARLTLEGQELWGCEVSADELLPFVEQPIVDKDGYIYVRQQTGFLCLDAHGNKIFEIEQPALAQNLMSIIGPGVLAYPIEDTLFIAHN